MSLGVFRERIAGLKERQIEVEAKTEELRQQSKASQSRRSRAEDEARCLERKKRELLRKLNAVQDEGDRKLERLERVCMSSDKTEQLVRKFERKELKDDDSIKHVEAQAKSTKIAAEEASLRLREAYSRLKVLEKEIQILDERFEKAHVKGKRFNRALEDEMRKIDGRSIVETRCEEKEERIRRLKDAVERRVIHAENDERRAAYLWKTKVKPLRDEVIKTQREKARITKDLRDLVDEMNTYPH